ncbi:MAG TPA: hypothetical protein ENI15_10750 [Spirochaetes bacterium]|nr:hypothetical protein [Spirochaetota bacterium]
MQVIYEPKGAALEYAELAVNLYTGCKFGCIYCYAPAIAQQNVHQFSSNPQPKKNVLKRLEADCKKMAGDKRTVLLCFTCDPYQSFEAGVLTREALLILEKYKMTATVLTKGGLIAERDFDILRRNNWSFGSTVHMYDNDPGRPWEPHAANNRSRCMAIRNAHRMGIKTWVSMEPVIYTDQALKSIEEMHCNVDFWKVGKMNHRDLDIDWRKFYDDVTGLLKKVGAEYYIKDALSKAAGI